MKFRESKVEIIPQDWSLDGIYKQCELAGRTAYKSEDRITEGSAKKFVEALMKLKHGAVLEHGTVYLTIPYEPLSSISGPERKYRYNKYSRVIDDENLLHGIAYVTTNLRVIFENDWMDDLQYLCEPTRFQLYCRLPHTVF